MSPTNEERRSKIEEHERQTPSLEAAERKARSIAQLKKEGVPVIDHLPVIADARTAKTRRVSEVCQRAIAICIAALKGEGLEQDDVDAMVKEHGADSFFSPKESAFIKDPNPSESDCIQFAWRYEAYWILLWALGYVKTLERPDGICDVAQAVSFLTDRDTTQFLNDAKLRPIDDILDGADLIYRYHWAVVNARVKGQDVPANLDDGVVQERHYTLNWLIGYMDQAWDDISTDT